MRLLTYSNPKTLKGAARRFLTAILHLAPHTSAGLRTRSGALRNVCPAASATCPVVCLNYSGRGRFDRTQEARRRKTAMFFEDRAGFVAQLYKDIGAVVRKADREGLRPAVRLNGTSDIVWEAIAPEIFRDHPEVAFYDYTKISGRRVAEIPNYSLTFSRSEENDETCRAEIARGTNVAVVFDRKIADIGPEPFERWALDTYGTPHVVDGDATDLRFLDPDRPLGSVIALYAKGDAKGDSTGFVVSLDAYTATEGR